MNIFQIFLIIISFISTLSQAKELTFQMQFKRTVEKDKIICHIDDWYRFLIYRLGYSWQDAEKKYDYLENFLYDNYGVVVEKTGNKYTDNTIMQKIVANSNVPQLVVFPFYFSCATKNQESLRPCKIESLSIIEPNLSVSEKSHALYEYGFMVLFLKTWHWFNNEQSKYINIDAYSTLHISDLELRNINDESKDFHFEIRSLVEPENGILFVKPLLFDLGSVYYINQPEDKCLLQANITSEGFNTVQKNSILCYT